MQVDTSKNKILSKSAQNVQNALSDKGLSFEVLELPSSTRTAIEAADTIGCEVAQIVKSLLFRSQQTHQPILVLASGVNRVNEKILEKLIGESIVKADADYTKETTGYAIGGIPPIGHKKPIEHIFVDADLLNFEKLWAAAGTPNAVFCFYSKDIQHLTSGKVISIN